MTTISEIQTATAAAFDVPLWTMAGPGRVRRIARPRQVAMYLAREMTDFSLLRIGRGFGRHHTSVLHAIRVVPQFMAADPVLREAVAALRTKLEYVSPGQTVFQRVREEFMVGFERFLFDADTADEARLAEARKTIRWLTQIRDLHLAQRGRLEGADA